LPSGRTDEAKLSNEALQKERSRSLLQQAILKKQGSESQAVESQLLSLAREVVEEARRTSWGSIAEVPSRTGAGKTSLSKRTSKAEAASQCLSSLFRSVVKKIRESRPSPLSLKETNDRLRQDSVALLSAIDALATGGAVGADVEERVQGLAQVTSEAILAESTDIAKQAQEHSSPSWTNISRVMMLLWSLIPTHRWLRVSIQTNRSLT